MKPKTSIAVVAVLAVACVAPEQDGEQPERSALEMRALATEDYEGGGGFDLEKEQERLQIWLDLDGNRGSIAREPRTIDLYNRLGAGQGGALSPELAWFPRRIVASNRDEDRWEFSFAMQSPEDRAVAVFDESAWNGGSRPRDAGGSLVELLPINMHSIYFTQNDVDPESIRVEMDNLGQPAITYRISPDRTGAYGDWTESLMSKKVAIIVDGVVLSAPLIQGRIATSGLITGGFSQETATSLADSIRESIASRSR